MKDSLWLIDLLRCESMTLKKVPFTPVSHPFVAGLVDTVRHEFPDYALFWTAADLKRKLTAA